MSLETMANTARTAEFQKYQRAYQRPNYKMGGPRMADAFRDLEALPVRGSYLDVSCGRGEMLAHAAALGFSPVHGTDIVPALIDGERVRYAAAHEPLPFEDKSFDVVTLLDVIEHLLPPDDEHLCRQIERVARKHILISANNKSSLQPNGDELHVNRRPYDEWDSLFRTWFGGTVARMQGHVYVSETWRIDL